MYTIILYARNKTNIIQLVDCCMTLENSHCHLVTEYCADVTTPDKSSYKQVGSLSNKVRSFVRLHGSHDSLRIVLRCESHATWPPQGQGRGQGWRGATHLFIDIVVVIEVEVEREDLAATRSTLLLQEHECERTERSISV